jgi:DNA repair protein RadD
MPVPKLRDYQEKAIGNLRLKLSRVNKVLLVSPTGSGKTVVMCRMIELAHEKGKRAIFVVRGKSLVDNGGDALEKYGIPHGVIMAGKKHRFDLPIHVCSIDTLYSRKIAPKADLVCIDEAHMTGGEKYKWLLSQYQDAKIVSVTATPYLKKGMRHIADDYIDLISMRELVQKKNLVPLRYFVPATIDTSNVDVTSTGDFDGKQLYKVVDDASVYGDLIESYNKFSNGKTAIAYGVNVKHARKIQEAFNEAGIPCGYIDGTTKQDDRHDTIGKLKRREIMVIASVGVLTTGVDIPCLETVLIARPTMSLNLHLQIMGRVTRPSPGKTHGLVIDHAGNVMRHGTATSHREVDLDGHKPKDSEIKPVICEKCFATFCPHENHINVKGLENTNKNSRHYICPECSHDNTPKRETEERELNKQSAEIIEIDAEKAELMHSLSHYEKLRKNTRNKQGRPYHWIWALEKVIADHGEEAFEKNLPEYWEKYRKHRERYPKR